VEQGTDFCCLLAGWPLSWHPFSPGWVRLSGWPGWRWSWRRGRRRRASRYDGAAASWRWARAGWPPHWLTLAVCACLLWCWGRAVLHWRPRITEGLTCVCCGEMWEVACGCGTVQRQWTVLQRCCAIC